MQRRTRSGRLWRSKCGPSICRTVTCGSRLVSFRLTRAPTTLSRAACKYSTGAVIRGSSGVMPMFESTAIAAEPSSHAGNEPPPRRDPSAYCRSRHSNRSALAHGVAGETDETGLLEGTKRHASVIEKGSRQMRRKVLRERCGMDISPSGQARWGRKMILRVPPHFPAVTLPPRCLHSHRTNSLGCTGIRV